jgi:hypothetical protein
MSKNHHENGQLPQWFEGSEALQTTLREVWETKYEELYEEDATDETYSAFRSVLAAFGLPDSTLSHKRYVYMGLVMALAARPTLAYRFPEDRRPDFVLQKVSAMLSKGQWEDSEWAELLFADYWTGAHTEANEAYDIFRQLLKMININHAYRSLFNILDSAINDDAISPHYWAKRSIFNWFLIDVVPAAYYLRLPATICTDRGTSVHLSAFLEQSHPPSEPLLNQAQKTAAVICAIKKSGHRQGHRGH